MSIVWLVKYQYEQTAEIEELKEYYDSVSFTYHFFPDGIFSLRTILLIYLFNVLGLPLFTIAGSVVRRYAGLDFFSSCIVPVMKSITSTSLQHD